MKRFVCLLLALVLLPLTAAWADLDDWESTGDDGFSIRYPDYMAVYGVPEEETGWISQRYIVYDEPHPMDAVMVITSEGRVACRKWIGGKIIRWMQDGERVHVFCMSNEWAVTEYGFIRCEYLTEE